MHYSQVKKEGYKSLKQGDYVSFDLIETGKGLQALNVCVINQAVATK